MPRIIGPRRALTLAPRKGGGGFNNPLFPKFSSAVRAMQIGAADADILFVGDSTTAGAGNGGVSGSLAGNSRAKNPAAKLAGLLTGLGATSSATVYGAAGLASAATYNAYDSRMTFGGGAGISTTGGAALGVMGSNQYRLTASGDSITYNVGEARDRLDLTMFETVSGSFAVRVGGSTVATVTTTAGAHQTVTLPDGTTSFDLVWLSGDCRITRIHPRSAGVKRLYTSSAGYPGRRADEYTVATTAQSLRGAIPIVRPALVIPDSWINDAGQGATETVYKAAIQSIINAAVSANADVLLVGGHHTSAGASVRPTYMGYLQSLATLNNVPFLDLATAAPQWATYAAANAAGYMDADGIHLTEAGSAAKAAAIKAVIAPTN